LVKDLLFLMLKIAAIVAVFGLLFVFVFGAIRYPDQSMSPAIKNGDLVVYFRHGQVYHAQDAVALTYQGQSQVRRVVAVAGDTVDITADGLLVNGALQQEPEIIAPTLPYVGEVDFPLTVPAGHVFVLADARDGATDSRVYGPVEEDDILGKVMLIIRRRGI
jgi:signal peptidase I